MDEDSGFERVVVKILFPFEAQIIKKGNSYFILVPKKQVDKFRLGGKEVRAAIIGPTTTGGKIDI